MADKEKLAYPGEGLLNSIRRNDTQRIAFPCSVVDSESFVFMDGERLYDTLSIPMVPDIDDEYKPTVIGRSILNRSLRNPLTSVDQIRAKQESLRELEANPELSERISDFLDEATEYEQPFFDYLLWHYRIAIWQDAVIPSELKFVYPHKRGDIYDTYKGARNYIRYLVEGASTLEPQTPYLQGLVNDLRELKDSDAYDLAEGRAYRTFRGIKTGKQKKFLEPGLPFETSSLKLALLPILAGAAFLTYADYVNNPGHFAPTDKALGIPLNEWSPQILGGIKAVLSEIPAYIAYALALRPAWRWADNKIFVTPLHELFFGKRYDRNSAVSKAIEGLGLLYEINCLDWYGKNILGPKTLPDIVDSDRHHFIGRRMRKPSDVLRKPTYVANSIDLDGLDPEKLPQRVTFLTGLNSGGKTELARTIAQTQLLGQVGGWVPAEHVEMSVADRIFYQAPIHGDDSEGGRFEAEAKRIRDVFYYVTTPRSLVVIDEPMTATSYKAMLEICKALFTGFIHKGNTTLVMTHVPELAKHFQEQGMGQFLEAGFVDGHPTYRFSPGVSEDSHPEFTLRKIGFSPEDIENHLREEGYIT